MNENASDPIRRLNEWALTTGRNYQSTQTKFIHYFHGPFSEEKSDTIPLYENTLFVLALFRSRLMENMQEAKQLLCHLLAFQIQTPLSFKGSFPLYLHHYPNCQDFAVTLKILTPFYWILKQFGSILGNELKHQLEQAIQLALEFCLKIHEEKPFSYPLAVRLAACQIAFKKNSSEIFNPLILQQLTSWHTTSHLSDILVGLQMIVPELSQSPWQPLWQRIEETWHRQTASYMGPHIREWEEQGEAKATLYDLYAGYFSNQFSSRAEQQNIFQLQGVLVQPTADRFSFVEKRRARGEYKQQNWQTFLYPNYAYTLFEKNHLPNPSLDKTWTTFRFVWGDLKKMFSFVCQGGQGEKVQVKQKDETFELIFDLNHSLLEEMNHKEKVVEFFISCTSDVQFKLNDQLTNTFKLDQLLQLNLGPFKFTMQWKLLSGKGDFFGHWMYGNRPSQLDQEGSFAKAQDWTFFLRSLRHQEDCRIQVLLEREK